MLGAEVATIKPDDLVRTPSGRTAVCIAINPDGSRELEDVRTGERFDMLPRLLYLVRAAQPKPWTDLKAFLEGRLRKW